MGTGLKSPTDGLSPAQRKRLAEDIYYLNITELRRFCEAHVIPYMIYLERPDGRIVQTRDADRKGVVIERILQFLRTGMIPPKTIFRKSAIATQRADNPPTESDRVLYHRFRNHDPEILELMKRLTAEKFEFGAVAQEVLCACWSRNEAPT